MSARLSSSLLIFLLASTLLLAQHPTLTVAAAADLSSLGPGLAAQFEKTNPIWVRFVNESSAMLSQQIENGAPYDLFLSANAEYVEKLAKEGKLLPDSVRIYAVGRVGLLWRDKKHHSLNDLAENWVRFVALPNPKLAPYGVAAQQALEHAGVWKMVHPKVVYGENVRQTLELFDSGNADAVLTSGALLKGRDADVLPAEWHAPIVQKAGVVAASSNRDAAEKFLDFLVSPAGQDIFAQFGFGSPPKH